MTTTVIANAEFVLWANDNLGYDTTTITIEKLQSMDKVSLGRLFLAFQTKSECPKELCKQAPKPLVCKVCKISLSRTDIFNCSLTSLSEHYCQNHQPASAAIEFKEIENPQCSNCGSTKKYPTYQVPWISDEQLKFGGRNVCEKCYYAFCESRPYVKPSVTFCTSE